jgi:hypothetical protein
MTLDNDARRIREAFNRELADCHAPADLAERARQGGQRRAAKRRLLATAGLAAAAARRQRRALAGTRPRWRVGRLAAGGLGLAVAAAIFAAVALQPASPRPVTGPGGGSTRLAAWTVTRQPDGLLNVQFRQLEHPAALQALLRKDGVPARVQFVRHGWVATTSTHIIPRSCSVGGPRGIKAGLLLQDKVFPPLGGPPNKQGISTRRIPPGLALIIRPSAIPSGIGLFLQIGPSGYNNVLVKATRACIGP